MRAGSFLAILAVTLMPQLACGSDADVPARAQEPDEEVGWWVFESPEFILVDGGFTDGAISESTGHLWTLEYSNGLQTLQLLAWRAESRGHELLQELPEVGSAKLEGFDVTFRRGPGIPEDEIPPSVGASWVDGDVLLRFGGGALSEAELRRFLTNLRQVSRAAWDQHVVVPAPSSSTDSTQL